MRVGVNQAWVLSLMKCPQLKEQHDRATNNYNARSSICSGRSEYGKLLTGKVGEVLKVTFEVGSAIWVIFELMEMRKRAFKAREMA